VLLSRISAVLHPYTAYIFVDITYEKVEILGNDNGKSLRKNLGNVRKHIKKKIWNQKLKCSKSVVLIN